MRSSRSPQLFFFFEARTPTSVPHRARQHADAWELQKQGNIHTSDDVITGTSVFRARVGG